MKIMRTHLTELYILNGHAYIHFSNILRHIHTSIYSTRIQQLKIMFTFLLQVFFCDLMRSSYFRGIRILVQVIFSSPTVRWHSRPPLLTLLKKTPGLLLLWPPCPGFSSPCLYQPLLNLIMETPPLYGCFFLAKSRLNQSDSADHVRPSLLFLFLKL